MPRKKKIKEVIPKRLKITLGLKREIIEHHERGMSVSALSRKYNRTASTICTILKNKDKIKEVDASMGVTRMSAQRIHVLDDVERSLLLWINERRLLGEDIKQSAVCEKAKMIFNDLIDKTPKSSRLEKEFKASRGWFEKFKRRIGFVKDSERSKHNPKVVNSFMKDFKNRLDAYLPQQVFSCKEMSLAWKKMPKQMENSQSEGELFEDRLSLLLCANASADSKIKPLLVYNSETPKAFRKCGVQKTGLNVMWRSNAKAEVTRELLIEWINEVFGPSVKKYLLEMNLPLQALLVLDGTSIHLPDLQDDLLREFQFIKSLPVSTVLHPMDQHVISDFRKLYIKALFEHCFEMTQDTNLTAEEFWKDHFHMVTCLKLIEKAWKQVSRRTLTSGWRKLWPECVFDEFEAEPAVPVVEEILVLAKRMGLEMSHRDVEILVQEYKPEMTTEDLTELEEAQEKPISSSSITEILNAWEKVSSFVKKHHPVRAMALHAINSFSEDALSPFEEILNRRKKRTTLRISHC